MLGSVPVFLVLVHASSNSNSKNNKTATTATRGKSVASFISATAAEAKQWLAIATTVAEVVGVRLYSLHFRFHEANEKVLVLTLNEIT